jgi:uncharacterized membrane protein
MRTDHRAGIVLAFFVGATVETFENLRWFALVRLRYGCRAAVNRRKNFMEHEK